MKFVSMMRIKNESAHIRESIESQLSLVDKVCVLDDSSTDDTVLICRSLGPKVVVFNSPFTDLDEARDKNYLFQRAVEFGPDWICVIDGDEVLERDSAAKISWYASLGKADMIAMRILYYWNDDQTLRTDRIYSNFHRPSAFRVTSKDLKWAPLSEDYAKGSLHCGSVPIQFRGASLVISDIAIWHYSAMNRDRRLERYNWYNLVDPDNYNEDCYRHAIQGDPGGPPAWMVMKHAGPLQLMKVQDFLECEDGRRFSRRPNDTVPVGKTPIRTHDLFDTLIARRCVDPNKIGLTEEFYDRRRKAELEVCDQPYTLLDVYQRLGEPNLLQRELDLEAQCLFPIAEMVAKVQPGDLIVSDTALPKEFLEENVRRVTGLTNEIVSSNDGKYTGRVFADIQKKYKIVEHIGDNWQSDVKMPIDMGILATHCKVSPMTEAEIALDNAGFIGLSQLMREVRLSTWNVNPNYRALQLLQSQVNVPVLFLASLILHRKMKAEGRKVALMSARDCFLWQEMLGAVVALFGDYQYYSPYFLTSRIPRVFPSEHYLAYVKAWLEIGPACLVDLTGTGWSFRCLLENFKDKDVSIFMLSRYFDARVERDYGSIREVKDRGKSVECLLRETSTVIEKANLANHPMIMDIDKEWHPIYFNPAGVDLGKVAGIKIQHDTFAKAFELMPKHNFSIDLEVPEKNVLEALKLCHARYAQYDSVVRFLFDDFFNKEDEALWKYMFERARAENVQHNNHQTEGFPV